MAVAEMVKKHGGSKVQVASALLHDTVEDTSVTNIQIAELFGAPVARLVHWLTDSSRPSDGNRAIRKGIDADRLANAPAEAQFVKLADMIDNSITIFRHDPGFATQFTKEMGHLVGVMSKVHGTPMHDLALKVLKT
jgi:(p)ppGpp synthase/HD superfamily hydrolase